MLSHEFGKPSVGNDELEKKLKADHDLRSDFETDMGIGSVFDSKGELKPEVLDFYIQKLSSDPFEKMAGTYAILQQFDHQIKGCGLLRTGLPLFEIFAEKAGDEAAMFAFYCSTGRHIIRDYLHIPGMNIEE